MKSQFDTTGLVAGDVIDQQTCESVIGFNEVDDPKGWALAILGFSGEVAKQIKKNLGRELTIRIHDNALHILTDQQAAEYNPRRFDAGLRLARRAHRRLMAVDVSKLNEIELRLFSRNVTTQAFKLAMVQKKAVSALTPTERSTPFMLKSPAVRSE